MIEASIVAVVNDEQPLKAKSPRSVIDDEIAISCKDMHKLKHQLFIVVTDVGITTFFSNRQPLNEWSPINVIVEGIVIFVNFLHSLKRESSISVRPWLRNKSTIWYQFFSAAVLIKEDSEVIWPNDKKWRTGIG